MVLLVPSQVLHSLFGVFNCICWSPERLFHLPLGRYFIDYFVAPLVWTRPSLMFEISGSLL